VTLVLPLLTGLSRKNNRNPETGCTSGKGGQPRMGWRKVRAEAQQSTCALAT
jgi:hypothetical protein